MLFLLDIPEITPILFRYKTKDSNPRRMSHSLGKTGKLLLLFCVLLCFHFIILPLFIVRKTTNNVFNLQN